MCMVVIVCHELCVQSLQGSLLFPGQFLVSGEFSSFTNSFSEDLVSVSYVPGTGPSAKDPEVNKTLCLLQQGLSGQGD